MFHQSLRRSFFKTLAITGSSLAFPAVSYSRVLGANERLRVASVGTGGKGWSDLNGVAASPNVQVVALCNIDQSYKHLGQAAEKFPQARQYADWRKLLDESKDVHAIIVSTPDFMHAPVGLAAMHSSKHLFCQKPLISQHQHGGNPRSLVVTVDALGNPCHGPQFDGPAT